MDWQPNVYSLALLITAVVAGATAWAAWRRRTKRGARPLAILALGLVVWSLAQTLDAAVADVPSKIFWTKWEYIGVVTVPTAWLVFCLEYTGLDARWLTPGRWPFLLIHPVLTLLLVWTNEWHGWIWREVTVKPVGDLWMWHSRYGWAFWIQTTYAYILLFIGTLLLARAAVRSPRPYRTQAQILLGGALIPWIVNGLTITHTIDTPINLTALGFTLDGVIAFWGLFKYRFLDLAPVARDAVVDSMRDAMVTLDLEHRIVDVNPAAQRLLDRPVQDLLGQRLSDLLPEQRALLARYEEKLTFDDEIEVEMEGEIRCYDLHISPLYDHRGRLEGRIIVLHDISERKRLQASLEAQVLRVNQLLKVARVSTASPSLEQTMRNSLEVAESITQAEAGSLMLVDEEGQVTHSILTRGEVPPDTRDELVRQVKEDGLLGRVLRQQVPLVVKSTQETTRWLTLPDQPYEAGSALGVPICYGERLLGGLILHHPQLRHFTEQDAEIMEAAARQMALALANAKVYEDQRLVAEQQTTLFEVLRRLQRPMSLGQAMQRATNVIAQLTAWPVIALLAPDPVTGNPSVRASAGRLSKLLLSLPLEPTSSDRPPGRPPPLFDAQFIRKCIPPSDFPSLLLIPLEGKAEDVMLLVASDVPLAFDGQARLLANSLGNITTLVLRNAQLYESVNSERQRLFALVQSSRDGIVMVGNNNRILVVSEKAVRYLGLKGSPGDWLYRTMRDALRTLRQHAPAVARSTVAEMRRLRDGDTSMGEGEYEVAGRVLRWFNLPVMDDDRSLGRLLILHDITREREIHQMREDLTHAMVHDLRSPLTNIHSSLWLLRRQVQDLVPSDPLEVLDIARRSTDELLGLVNAILDISRLESGRMPLDLKDFPLSGLAAEVLELERPQAQQKQIELLNAVPDDLPLVQADRQLIVRVVQNLLDNAVKFTPEGGRVHLRARVARHADEVLFSVQDNGPGIPSDVKDRIFEKFVTGQQDGHGSGLGLTFCKMVLEAHGQRIWVESRPFGSTFTFTLPLVERSAP
jgi:PAS domain S-box-containing protein